MPPERLYSAAEAGAAIGQDKSNIARLAKRVSKQLGVQIGQQVGRAWAFTAADIKKMKANAYEGPGSPAFTEGNTLAAKGVAKRWGKRPKKKKAD